MKKTLSCISVASMLLIGCGDGISDEMVANYQKSLNSKLSMLKELAQSELEPMGAKLTLNDFACKAKSGAISCVSENISIESQGQNILKIGSIQIDNAQVYKGDKKGQISISDAYANIAKDGFSDSIKINNLELGEMTKGLASMAALGDDSLWFLPVLAAGKYNISLDDSYKNKNNLEGHAKLTIDDINQGSKLSLQINHAIDYKTITNVVDKLGLARFDVSTQSIVPSEQASIDDMGDYEAQEQIASAIWLSQTELSASFKDISQFKAGLDRAEEKFKNKSAYGSYAEENKLMLQVIDKFRSSKTLTVNIKHDPQISLLQLVNGDHTILKGLGLVVNGVDFTKAIKDAMGEY